MQEVNNALTSSRQCPGGWQSGKGMYPREVDFPLWPNPPPPWNAIVNPPPAPPLPSPSPNFPLAINTLLMILNRQLLRYSPTAPNCPSSHATSLLIFLALNPPRIVHSCADGSPRSVGRGSNVGLRVAGGGRRGAPPNQLAPPGSWSPAPSTRKRGQAGGLGETAMVRAKVDRKPESVCLMWADLRTVWFVKACVKGGGKGWVNRHVSDVL